MKAVNSHKVALRSHFVDWVSHPVLQDAVFAGLIILTRLGQGFGALGALLCLILLSCYGVLRAPQIWLVFQRCWPHLLYVFFAILSMSWATFPIITLRAALQMGLTVFGGLLLSQSKHPRAVLAGLSVVYVGYSVASLLANDVRPDGGSGAMALYGFSGEAKNYFSDTSSTATLLSITVFILCIEWRAWLGALVSVCCAALCAFITVKAHSAGGLASLAVSSLLLCGLLMLRERSPAIKLLAVSILLGIVLISSAFFQPLLSLIQESAGKDTGLTGRGYLWFRAEPIIAQNPWLGRGYFGFWTSQNPDAVGFWRYFDIRNEGTGFSFHNSYIQVIVELGYLGLSILILSWIFGVVTLLRQFVLTHSVPVCFCIAYVGLQLSKSGVELVSPGTFVAPTIMLSVALGYGCRPVRLQAVVRKRDNVL